MKITIFTSNQPRHLNFVNLLSNIGAEVHAVLECNTVFPGQISDFFKKSESMQKYFTKVLQAEKKIFGQLNFSHDMQRTLSIKSGDLNRLDRDVLAPALNSDIYIVFGSSYIKGWLIDFLVENRALNIHMGVSPYFRGSSCNFWALYKNRADLVGATIHMLSKGLDSGDMLYHALPTLEDCDNAFDFTMKSVKVAQQSLCEKIKERSIFDLPRQKQDKSIEISYTRNEHFNDHIVDDFLNRNTVIEDIKAQIQSRDEFELFLSPVFG